MTTPIDPRPQPVIDAARLGGLVSGALVACSSVFFLVQAGIDPNSITALGVAVQGAVTAVVSLLAYILPRLHAKRAAAHVTPLSDPRDDQGQALAADTYGRHAAKEATGGYVGGPGETATPRLHNDYVISRAEVERLGHDFLHKLNRTDTQEIPRVTDEPEDRWAPGWYDRGGVLPPAVTVTYNATGKPILVVTRTDTQEIPRVTDEPVRRIPEHVVPGKRLGRHVRHDPRSLRFLVPETSTPTTAMWQRRVPVFDQGNLGSCTGNAAAGVLGTDPFYGTLPAGLVDDENEAVSLYSAATKLDDYDGSYPPDDTGSDGLSVAKACKQAGLISGYTHITSVAAAQTAIKSGPFIVGVNWYSSMDNPNADGLVKVSGQIRGGHEFECHGYDAEADLWWFTNSWGTGWGKQGTFCMSSASFARLLSEQGDATVFLPIAAPFPPQPTPTPTPTPPAPAPSLPPSTVAALMARILRRKGSPKEDIAAANDYDEWLAGQ